MTGLRYLVRVSGPDIPGFERRYRWLYPALTPVIRATWRSAAVLVAKCESEASMIRAVDDSIGIRIIPNGVDVGAFPQGGRDASGPVRLLCVARLIERKGQHDLLKALRSLIERGIDARLELVGEGDARGSLEQLASSLGVRHLVHFAGYVPRDAIPRKYADADIFVLPSYNEGMSVATLEAMASGLPVIVTRVGGVDELVAEGVNGLTFDWGDVDALVSCLDVLARDPDRRRRLGQASRVRATAFSWQRMTRAYVELLDELGSVQAAQAQRSHPIVS
jgi:glycosyltransferase involved in cell wall biosynthesis